MKERPILFSGPMVCQLLTDRKIVTRRLPRLRPALFREPHTKTSLTRSSASYQLKAAGVVLVDAERPVDFGSAPAEPGDRLWVRETWAAEAISLEHDRTLVRYKVDGATEWRPGVWDKAMTKVRPGIHMPRPFARLTLEVVGVRLELLHDITEQEIRNEGVASGLLEDWISLWDGLNMERAPWESNPAVWRVAFRRLAC